MSTDYVQKCAVRIKKSKWYSTGTKEFQRSKNKVGQNTSRMYGIGGGVPQGSVLSLILYSPYTADMLFSDNALTATYADDTAVLACSESPI